ncbi:MAG: T9SS type A sorting domain-containing protein [Bacteroidales bacterium]|jgi:hypothetical protein|nr:T9SS type A sorting domain-containing protein [Bacteroidales bacterium]
MKQRFVIFTATIILSLVLSSWGDVGHSMISLRAELSFNEEMSAFHDWVDYLSDHASDPDWRKKTDPTEKPKHYIDIDNYDSFVDDGKIPQTLDSCIAEYGSKFVGDNGSLPWATLNTYDSIVRYLKIRDIEKAKFFSADLGHYVADGHMPMHLTKNYDGQFTGNKGIHYRYEIEIIDKYKNEINYSGSPAEEIANVGNYVFGYIYDNYEYMDSILIADDYGEEMAENKDSDLYYAALWEKTENMTKEMFKRASHAFAELLYAAWIEAGRPNLAPSISTLEEGSKLSVSISPNPVYELAQINYNIPNAGLISATIYDTAGKIATQWDDFNTKHGIQSISWNSTDFANGAYLLVFRSSTISHSELLIVAN